MERESKPFRVVGGVELVPEISRLMLRCNAEPWRGWPPDSVTIRLSATRLGERFPRWVFTITPTPISAWLRIFNPKTGRITQYRIIEAADFSILDRLETAVDFRDMPRR